jgi:hypothetical protein
MFELKLNLIFENNLEIVRFGGVWDTVVRL